MIARIALVMTLLMVSNLVTSANCLNNCPSYITLKSIGEGPLFFVDYTNFQGLDNLTYVEFYIQVGYNELQFIKNNGRFSAGYELEFIVYNEENNVVESYTNLDVFEVDTYLETQSIGKARVCLLGYSFEPGNYKLLAVITDLETQKTSKLENVFVARNFHAKDLMISDIQLSQKIAPAEDGQPYVKNQRYIEPNAVRIFAPGLADIYIYFEIYNLAYSQHDENTTYTAYFIFKDNNGKKIAQFQHHENKPGSASAHSLKVSAKHFASGTYTLTIRIRDDDTGQLAESSKSFMVLEAPISLSDRFQNEVSY